MMESDGFETDVFGPSLLGPDDGDIAELGVFLLGVDSFVGVASEGVDILAWRMAPGPTPLKLTLCWTQTGKPPQKELGQNRKDNFCETLDYDASPRHRSQ